VTGNDVIKPEMTWLPRNW